MWKFKPFMPKENAGLGGRTIDVGNLKVHVRNAIAEGGFSCVYLGRDAIHPSKQYALKHMICNDKESLSVVMKEISVMKRLKGHPNVVVLAASDIFDMGRTKEAIIVMDFYEKSLVSVLESRGAMYYEEKQVLLIFRDVCNAVFAMHCQSPPIAHRDLKAENVLLGSDGTWKLCDFGSTSTNHKRFDKPGEMGIEEDNIRKHTTPAYRAPEMWDLLRRDIVSEKVDIWALGCLLYRICFFKSAFDGESKLQVLNGNYRIPEMPKYNSSITNLIKDMLQMSPDSRPDITQVWFQVNLLLPLDLQKETPNGSFSRTTTDVHMPAINAYDEVTTKMSPVMPQKIAPYSSSTKGQVRSMSARYVEERPRTSLRDPKTTGDGPLGMFWTNHQSSTLVTENKIPESDKELSSQSVSKHNEQKIGKRSSPSREKITKEPLRTVRGDSVIKSDDVPSADFEIRFESGRGIGKTKISYAGNQKTAVLNSENRTPFPNETFNTFVAEFDSSKLGTDSGSRKDLQGELESLKKQLKQSNLEKTDMTSKFEKLSAICRSQRQEIQELKRALAAVNQPPSNKVNLKSQSTPCSGQSSFQQREKIEGSLLELQEGVFANASSSRGKDSRAWQPFAKEPKPLATSKSNNSKSVRTSDCCQSKSNSASIATGSWSFDQDGFTAAVSSSQTSRTSFQSNSSQQYSTSNVKKVQTTKPAGWAGF